MRNAIYIIITALMMISYSICADAKTFHEQVSELMESLFERVPVSSEEVRVYIQPPKFVSDKSEETDPFMGGGFIRHFKAACGNALRAPFYEIPRDDLDQIWSEVKVARMTESSDPDKALKSMEALVSEQVLIPMDGIIIAECSFPSGENPPKVVYVNIYFLDVKKVRKYTAVGEIQLTPNQSSEIIEKPRNYQLAREQKEKLSGIISEEIKRTSQQGNSLFNLSVNVDRSVYQQDEDMTIYVSTEYDCYIALINVNVEGNFTLLFPNGFERNNFVRAGQILQVPGPEPRKYDLIISPPFGAEIIKVIASRTPFQFDSMLQSSGSNFLAIGNGLSTGTVAIKTMVKSVSVRARPAEDQNNQPQFAEAMCTFTTIPAAKKGLW